MAIDSIGPKMMVQSAPDNAKDASAIQRRGEHMQNAATQQVRTETERMSSEVIDVYKAENPIIQRERERRRQEQRQREEEELVIEIPEDKKKKLPEVGVVYKNIDISI